MFLVILGYYEVLNTNSDYFCRLSIYDGGFRNSLSFCYKAEKAARKDLFGDDHR